MAVYGSLVTNAGDALVAAALIGGPEVELATIVVGDANGDDVLPDAAQTDLINQRYQASITSLTIDGENPNQIMATAVIPAEIGGWDIREIGVKTLDGTLFAVGNFSPARKPVAAEGSVWVMELTVAIAVASTSAITLVVDPEIDYATKQWCIDNFEPKGAGGAWVPITRILTAGAGLLGGGNLTQDRAFAADKPWFDMRYSAVDHLHDLRYSRLDHTHGAVVASGASGFMTGADKTKLDGLGAAGMRLLASASTNNSPYVDLTLEGPFDALLVVARYKLLGGTVGSGGNPEDTDELYAHIATVSGSVPVTKQNWNLRPGIKGPYNYENVPTQQQALFFLGEWMYGMASTTQPFHNRGDTVSGIPTYKDRAFTPGPGPFYLRFAPRTNTKNFEANFKVFGIGG